MDQDQKHAIIDDIIHVLIDHNLTVYEAREFFREPDIFTALIRRLVNPETNPSGRVPHIREFLTDCYPHHLKFVDLHSLRLYPAQRRAMYDDYRLWCRHKDMIPRARRDFYRGLFAAGFQVPWYDDTAPEPFEPL